jgi:hypothetical protein
MRPFRLREGFFADREWERIVKEFPGVTLLFPALPLFTDYRKKL